MSLLIIGILLAFGEAVLHAIANIIDNFLTNKVSLSIWSLIFYNSLLNILFLPLVFLLDTPSFPPLHLIPFFVVIAIIEILYLYPYYKALQYHDTSAVTALFALGKIFVPLFSFFIVHELLSFYQYLGFFIIVVGSIILSIERKGKIKLNKAFFFMLICSIMLSLEAVIYKYIFMNVGWGTGFVWPAIFSFFMVFWILFIPKKRTDIKKHLQQRTWKLFLLEEFLTFLGTVAGTYAIFYIPVTIVKGITSFQPFFVLFYAIVFRKRFQKFFKEKITLLEVCKKMAIFAVMFIGASLIF